jgi:hypothetical protein
MVSARAELRQFSKESLVCVTSMVSFQVFVRLPKLCQREMSWVLKICSEAIKRTAFFQLGGCHGLQRQLDEIPSSIGKRFEYPFNKDQFPSPRGLLILLDHTGEVFGGQ